MEDEYKVEHLFSDEGNGQGMYNIFYLESMLW